LQSSRDENAESFFSTRVTRKLTAELGPVGRPGEGEGEGGGGRKRREQKEYLSSSHPLVSLNGSRPLGREGRHRSRGPPWTLID
jgi:hypothetical protein